MNHHPSPRRTAHAQSKVPGRFARALAGLLAAVAISSGLPGTADAATSSSVGTAAATSYGFECNAEHNWVHQNWPDISVRSDANQDVATRAMLYRWNGRGWDVVQTSQWYVGVSDVTGRQALGFTVGSLPYYFAIAGEPSLVPANDGYGFDGLPEGYYATVEQYRAGGADWTANTTVEGTTDVTFCQV